MRTFLLSSIILLAFSQQALSHVVYSTTDGNLGLIHVFNSASADLAGIQYFNPNTDTDTALGSYWDGDNTRVILVNKADFSTTSWDNALIFNPASLSQPIHSYPITLKGVVNTQRITGSFNGRSLFFASGPSIREFDTSTFSETHSYTYTPASGDTYIPTVKSLVSGKYMLYCLVDRQYLSPKILGFDGQLKDNVQSFVSVNISEDASCIAWLSNSRIVAGSSVGVSLLGFDGFNRIISSDAPVTAICHDGGNGFFFAEQLISQDQTISTLKHYNPQEDTLVTTLYSDNSGASCQLVRDDNNGIMVAVLGGKILLFRIHDDLLVAEFDSNSLGGLPLNVAMSYIYGDDGDISNGCNVLGFGAGFLLLPLLLLL